MSGQPGRTLNIRYNEQGRNIKYSRKKSAFSTDTLKNIHRYGRTGNIMDVIEPVKKNSKTCFKRTLH
jgi:hypothetical protein